MRPDESFVNQPVRSLQTMLRVLAQEDPSLPNVSPDGIYGPQTAQAVSAFQRREGLPVTGTADERTWEALRQAHKPAIVRQGKAQGIQVHLKPGEVLGPGDRTHQVAIAQLMLLTVMQGYSNTLLPDASGVMDDATAASLKQFQRLSGLPDTGTLDRITWKNLALQYSRRGNELTRQNGSSFQES